jgi:HD superfamily phosphohydrolase YqeK
MKFNDAANFFFQHPAFNGAYGKFAVAPKITSMLRRPSFEPVVNDIVQMYSTPLTYHNYNHAFLVADAAYSIAVAHDMESIETKALIIAALLHDANHQGNKNDAVNIEASLACAENIIYDSRTSNLIGMNPATRAIILDAIRCTEFDGKTRTFPHEPTTKVAKILRDADLLNFQYASWPQIFTSLCLEIGRPLDKIYDVAGFSEYIAENVEFLSAQTIYSDVAGIRTVQNARDKYFKQVKQVLTTFKFGA